MKISIASLAPLAALVAPTGMVQAAKVLPKEAATNTPWDDLKSLLSSPDILTPSSTTEWQEQCVQIFEDVGSNPGIDGSFAAVSNYQLMNQSSGLCLGHVSCAYEMCKWPATSITWPYYPPNTSPFVIVDGTGSEFTPDADDMLVLPAMVMEPRSAVDIVRAVEFCQTHDVGITVKVAGHSYFGASTARNTLLIKMNPYFPKYAIDGSLTECAGIGADEDDADSSATSATQMACAVALSRNKNAVLKVGGGELFDEAYRAVSFIWNSANPDSKYHLVGGGAGTVSVAGDGWPAEVFRALPGCACLASVLIK